MARRSKRGRDVSGILVLDKPRGESSNKSLQKVKHLLQAAKAGHTGSLDPLATGVLPLCFGEATKVSQFLLEADKVYRTVVRLGVKTDSGDSEGEVIREAPVGEITDDVLEQALDQFRGEIEQTPSMFSALKHQGVPLYKLARQGKSVERKSRRVTIYDLKLLERSQNTLTLDIHCSKGTYIRTIADDLGDLLGTGGHVEALRRLKAGPFTLDDSKTFEDLETLRQDGGFTSVDACLIPADRAIEDLPEVTLPSITADFVRQGQPVLVRHLPTEGLVRLYDGPKFIGVGEILDDGRVAPKRLFL